MRLPVLLCFIAAAVSAQPITIGIKTGIPFIDPYGAGGDSAKLAGGGSVEFRLPHGFAVEGSAIYRHTSETALFLPVTGYLFPTGAFNQIRGNSWEFPVIGKYYLRPRTAHWQPFLGAGAAIRAISATSEGLTMSLPDGSGIQANAFRAHTTDSAFGAVAAAGVRIRSGRFAIVPEFRYTRWGAQSLVNRRNDPGLYVGFTF